MVGVINRMFSECIVKIKEEYRMQERLQELQAEALQKVDVASDLKELNDIRVAYLGKKGPITEVLRGMGKLSAEERPKMGALSECRS